MRGALAAKYFYPGTGDSNDYGAGKGDGYTLNVPLGRFGDKDVIYTFEEVILPAISRFAPDIIFVSCGFDA